MLCANRLNQARRGLVGQNNYTDFTLLQEELNAPILGHCGLILQLAPIIGSTLGPTAPKRSGAAGGKRWGTIDLG